MPKFCLKYDNLNASIERYYLYICNIETKIIESLTILTESTSTYEKSYFQVPTKHTPGRNHPQRNFGMNIKAFQTIKKLFAKYVDFLIFISRGLE